MEAQALPDALPHDLFTERAVIGSLLLEPHRVGEVAALPVTAFYSERHRFIFRGIAQTLVKHGTCDLILLHRHLCDTDQLKGAGGAKYLAELHAGAWTASNITHYAGVLRELEARRDAITGATAAATLAQTEGSEAVRAVLVSLSKRLERQDEPALREIDIWAACNTPISPIPWIAEGWLAEDDRVIFGGEWGTGKSLIVDDLVLAVTSGIDWMGMIPVIKTGPVLYVDEENPSRVVESRFYRMVRGRGLDPTERRPIRYLTRNRIKLDQPRGLAALRRVMDVQRPVLVILDSMARFHTRSENDNSEMSAFLDEALMPLCIDYGCAFVILDHMRKPGKDDEKQEVAHRIRGAGSKMDITDTGWVIYGDRNTDERTFECRKNRSGEALPGFLTTKWVKGGDSEDPWARVEATAPKAGCDMAIWTHLARSGDDGALRKDVFDQAVTAGFGRRGLEKALATMTSQGKVKRGKDHGKLVRLWLTQNAPAEAE